MAMPAGLVTINENFTCPITCKIMADPVGISSSGAPLGVCYEREAIQNWLQHDRRPPKSPWLLPQEVELVPHHKLKGEISGFLEAHPQFYKNVYLPDACMDKFCAAIKRGEVKIAQELLKNYPTLLIANTKKRGYTIFHLVAEYGPIELVDHFLKELKAKNMLGEVLGAPAPVGFKSVYLNSLLEQSIRSFPMKDDSLIKKAEDEIFLLLKLGARLDFNKLGDGTLLHIMAIQDTSVNVVRRLFELQPSDMKHAMEYQNTKGETPLLLAALHGNVTMTELLLEQGADQSTKNKEGQNVAAIALSTEGEKGKSLRDVVLFYTLATEAEMKSRYEIVESLLKAGADATAAYGQQRLNIFHIAAKRGDIALFRLILKYLAGNDGINSVDDKGNTPLHYAVQGEHEEVVRLLLGAGASRDIMNLQGYTPLYVAPTTESRIRINACISQTVRVRELEQRVRFTQLDERCISQAEELEQLRKQVIMLQERLGKGEEVEEIKTRREKEGQVKFIPLTFQFESFQYPSTQLRSEFDLKVTKEAVQKFLGHVVAGEQGAAQAMLNTKLGPALALAIGTVTDHAGREFRDITGFQYAVWALDWHMWQMIQPYLSERALQEQAQAFDSGVWVTKHGKHVDWNKLIAEQRILSTGTQSIPRNSAGLIKKIGALQAQLPIHVLQEYCQPMRGFSPCPDFAERYNFNRSSLEFIDKLGQSMALVRYGLEQIGIVTPDLQHGADFVFINNISPTFFPLPVNDMLDQDCRALEKLLNTRIAQRTELVTWLKKDYEIVPGGSQLRKSGDK